MTYIPKAHLLPTKEATFPVDLSTPRCIPPDHKPHVTHVDGGKILIPVAATKNQADIMSFAGIAAGAWGGTAQEIDKALSQTKSGWQLHR